MGWDTVWTAVKDIALTGTGLVLILSQAFSASPKDIILVAGLALTTPSVASHARAILGAHTGSHSSGSSPPDGPSPSTSSSPPGGTGGE